MSSIFGYASSYGSWHLIAFGLAAFADLTAIGVFLWGDRKDPIRALRSFWVALVGALVVATLAWVCVNRWEGGSLIPSANSLRLSNLDGNPVRIFAFWTAAVLLPPAGALLSAALEGFQERRRHLGLTRH